MLGRFRPGSGSNVVPDDDTIAFCVEAKTRGGPLPVRHSLAATLYGDQLLADAPPGPADLVLLQSFFEVFTTEPASRKNAPPKISRGRLRGRSNPRKRS